MPIPELTKVESSMIVSVAFEPVVSMCKGFDAPTELGAIYVRFKKGNGALWRYGPWPRSLYEEFRTAPSPGAFFLAKIKGKSKREELVPDSSIQ